MTWRWTRDGLPRDFSDIPANIVALWLGFIQQPLAISKESEGARDHSSEVSSNGDVTCRNGMIMHQSIEGLDRHC